MITRQILIRTKELICKSNEAEILVDHVKSDHIHLVSVPLHLPASKLVQYIKGNKSRKLQMEYKKLNKQFWGTTFVGKRILFGKWRECNR